ncbi:hypothetical protein BU096_00505 [Staphylococcus xylosus]|uniref:hypothetical protein n=1 Tax=Staphylococcus xylosus TaxID=1288 RepID=UPI000D1F2984|nr:hypothetical protein [Staphylococcus xylosus]PTI10686.1 hypothetical protein BU096_00505 [Staphylococcus xylosus]
MSETVYLYDGTPITVHFTWNYPREPYTKIPPYNGISYPIYFNELTQRWVGSEPPLTNSDYADLEDAINSQNDKFVEIIDKNNQLVKDNVILFEYVSKMLLILTYMKDFTDFPQVVMDNSDIEYFYNKGLFTDFKLRQLVDKDIISSEYYHKLSGDTYPSLTESEE